MYLHVIVVRLTEDYHGVVEGCKFRLHVHRQLKRLLRLLNLQIMEISNHYSFEFKLTCARLRRIGA
jgi:hypothetical protein